MSVYVGIDVHRKRSQVVVVNQSGEVLTNRNVPNGVERILSVIGGLSVWMETRWMRSSRWSASVVPTPARAG